MLKRSGLKPEAFISCIERTIGESRQEWTADVLTREVVDSHGGIIYLSAGYWRAKPVWSDDDRLIGVSLINPDRTADEIRHVERGIGILRHLEFV